uniref:RRM domain-containing protein n=1 Tax=Panagrolaimus superbus TaxID=310955 RepID=A0A914XWE0_9BILA
MATFAPNEMYLSQQQQQQTPQIRMAYPLDLSFPNQMQYQGPSSPFFQQSGEAQPGSSDSPCQTVASVINHRVFVGSLQIEVTEEILKSVFEKVEPSLSIRDTKIVREQNGQSKGYGFVTYATEEDAQKVINKPAGSFGYRSRSWNVAPAVRRFTPHAIPSSYLCYPYSPSMYAIPNGIVGYLPQQVYNSPSPFMTSPLMDQNQFVFPPPQQ